MSPQELNHLLQSSGVDVQVDGPLTVIRVPSQITVGCLLSLCIAAIVVGLAIFGVAMLLGATTNLAIWIAVCPTTVTALGLCGLEFKISPRAYSVRIDDRNRRVSIDPTTYWKASDFRFDEVISMGVDWHRMPHQQASKDAPIKILGVGGPNDRGLAFLPLGALKREQARAFVQWLHQRVAPNARLDKLDPD